MDDDMQDAPTEQAQATDIKFFDAGSRIGRARYLAYAWGVLLLLLPAIILGFITANAGMGLISALLFIACEVFALVMSGVFIVRRLHDFERSGWWSLIYWGLQVWSLVLSFQQLVSNPLGPRSGGSWLATLLLLSYLLVLVLVPGTRAANRYGPVPPPNTTWVLVGAWTWLVALVLGVLAGISIPAYQDFVARSQTAEGIQLAGGAEMSVAEYYDRQHAWPGDLAGVYVTAGQQPAGRFVDTVTGHAAGDQSYGVVATLKAEGVTPRVAGKSLEIWTTDGGKTWHCGPGGDDPVEFKFLPPSCRDTGAP